MSSLPPSGTIFEQNPYENHPSLSAVEAEVLWEYAKLAQNVRLVTTKTRTLMDEPDQMLVARLRSLETKMGLVMVLFKASVWNVINEQPVDVQYGPPETSEDTTIRQ